MTTNICVVHAPRIHPSLPPAIDTSRMEKKSKPAGVGSMRVNRWTQLEKDVTPTLSQFAGDPRHIDLVREECRKNCLQQRAICA